MSGSPPHVWQPSAAAAANTVAKLFQADDQATAPLLCEPSLLFMTATASHPPPLCDSPSVKNAGEWREGVVLRQNDLSVLVREVALDVPTVDQGGERALHFVKIWIFLLCHGARGDGFR